MAAPTSSHGFMLLPCTLLLSCALGSDPFAGAFETPDADNDGFPDHADCAPDDALSHPASLEICDHVDNDCDGLVDEEPVNGDSWYLDRDGDGHGDLYAVAVACELPPGHTARAGDCDDGDPATHPDATERCDGADNDCDDLVDERAVDSQLLYADQDDDNFGSPYSTLLACELVRGYVLNDGDCNDRNDEVHPEADDPADDGVDWDCDGQD